MMNDFFYSYSKIIGFVVLVLIFNMMFGNKPTERFLQLVLLSMILLNSGKTANFLAKFKV